MIECSTSALAVAAFWVPSALAIVSSLSWTSASSVIVLITRFCGRSQVHDDGNTLWLPDGVCLCVVIWLCTVLTHPTVSHLHLCHPPLSLFLYSFLRSQTLVPLQASHKTWNQ